MLWLCRVECETKCRIVHIIDRKDRLETRMMANERGKNTQPAHIRMKSNNFEVQDQKRCGKKIIQFQSGGQNLILSQGLKRSGPAFNRS